DGLAQLHLTQDDLNRCAQLLDRIDESVRTDSDRRLYTYRHAQLTRVRLLMRQHRWADALSASESLRRVAMDAGDHLLSSFIDIIKAELLAAMQLSAEFVSTLDDWLTQLTRPLSQVAEYERVLACGLGIFDTASVAQSHLDRARRIHDGLRNAPGVVELLRRWNG